MFRFKNLRNFAILALLGIVVFSALWIYVGRYFSIPAAYLTKWILEEFARGWVNYVSIDGGFLILNSSIELLNEQTGWRRGEVMVEENFTRYTYSFSISFSLFLAMSRKNLLVRVLKGYVALIPLQAFSLTFLFLMRLCISVDMDLSLLRINGFALSMLIYFYQFGILILPVLAPVIIWLYIDKDLIKQLVVIDAASAAQQVKP
ncbi:exosortase H-associated membrane protein [Comamonas sp.]|uniref:exosortase H-associated membrane protein n=1 Tax=Comamonas sp. TaxID=34028 RepID=UPI00258FEFFB|nr:exosortase H-associated membrane protein [Comamonas sp.]